MDMNITPAVKEKAVKAAKLGGIAAAGAAILTIVVRLLGGKVKFKKR